MLLFGLRKKTFTGFYFLQESGSGLERRIGEKHFFPHHSPQATPFGGFPLNFFISFCVHYLLNKPHVFLWLCPSFSWKKKKSPPPILPVSILSYSSFQLRTQVNHKVFLDPLGKGLTFFFPPVEGQIVNISGFLGHIISVASIQFCCVSWKQT